MTAQFAIQKKLFEKFAEAKSRNSAYSLRAFSKKLGLNSGIVSSILNGKRRISKSVAEKIAHALALDPQERTEFLADFDTASRKRKTTEQVHFLLAADQFQTISEWHHFAILALIKTSNFSSQPEQIAKRLDLSVSTVHHAIERLTRIGLLKQDEQGQLTRSHQAHRTTDDISSPALRRAHAANLDLARKSLERDSLERRDFTATTMAINPQHLPKAKELIRKFQDDLNDLLEEGPTTDVYKVCVQLFPLTQ